jgi:hypothetical protein
MIEIKGKLLKKFSLKIPFKTFHVSADVAASPASSARINEKILEKGFRGILFKIASTGASRRGARQHALRDDQ